MTNARPTMIDLSNLHGIELEKARGFNIACVHWEAYLKDAGELIPLDEDNVASVIREIDPKGAPRKLAKAICQKFGTQNVNHNKDEAVREI